MITIEVRIIPNARKISVAKEGERYKVHVMAPAVDGKANQALLEALADFFKIKKNNLEIIRGEKSKNKIIRISTTIDQ